MELDWRVVVKVAVPSVLALWFVISSRPPEPPVLADLQRIMQASQNSSHPLPQGEIKSWSCKPNGTKSAVCIMTVEVEVKIPESSILRGMAPEVAYHEEEVNFTLVYRDKWKMRI